MIASLAVVIVLILGIFMMGKNTTYPKFASNRLLAVSGTSEITRLEIDKASLKNISTINIDVGLYIKSILLCDDILYISGVKNDSESATVNGIYRVDQVTGSANLVYDSGDDSVFKIFCVTMENKMQVAAIDKKNITIIDPDSGRINRRIDMDFQSYTWSQFGENLLAGLDHSDSSLHIVDISSKESEVDTLIDISDMISLRSKQHMYFKRNGAWWRYDSAGGIHQLNNAWATQNAVYSLEYPKIAIEDINDNLLHMSTNELKGITNFIYLHQNIGKVRGSIFDIDLGSPLDSIDRNGD